MARTAAVFFDVDFTLIYPGPRFRGEGYHESCARHGIVVDPARFDAALAGAAPELDAGDGLYDPQIFINYARRVIELMGGDVPEADRVARELYEAWAEQHHFSLYDDVVECLTALRAGGLRLGLISNSHRCLDSFQAHFALDGLVHVAVSSSALGYMKPHPEIFRTALERMGVHPADAMMVGDSVAHDVNGARAVGMQAVLLARGDVPAVEEGVMVIRSLRELASVLDVQRRVSV